MRDGHNQSADWEQQAEEQVREVLGSLRAELRGRPSQEDLISSRQLDSLLFVSVLYGLEERSGREVDLDRLGGSELRTIRGLAHAFFGPQHGEGR